MVGLFKVSKDVVCFNYGSYNFDIESTMKNLKFIPVALVVSAAVVVALVVAALVASALVVAAVVAVVVATKNSTISYE